MAIQTTEATLGITMPCVSRVLLFPGNRRIIVATDHLTRYAETKALTYRTAVQVAKFFVEPIVPIHRASEILVTDQGTACFVQLTQGIFWLSHTSHHRTTTYHLQTSGLTERLNKTFDDMMYVDVEQKRWARCCPTSRLADSI